jgi:hypothetical protein
MWMPVRVVVSALLRRRKGQVTPELRGEVAAFLRIALPPRC